MGAPEEGKARVRFWGGGETDRKTVCPGTGDCKALHVAVRWETQNDVLRSRRPLEITSEEASRRNGFTVISQPPGSSICHHVRDALKQDLPPTIARES